MAEGGPPIKPVSASLNVQMMLHGVPGVGKTTLIGTGGKDYKTLIIRPPTDHTDAILGSGCEEWVVKTWEEMLEEVVEYLQHEGQNWDWVWLDSISAWQDHGLDDIWQQTIDRRPDRKNGPIDRGEYGLNMTRVQQWVRIVSGISMSGAFHLGITAWSEYLWDEQKQREVLKPWVQGKMMSDKIMGYMNIVAFMEATDKGRRVLRFDLTDDYYGKDQFNAFPNHRLRDPSMPKVMEHLDAARAAAVPKPKARSGKKSSTRRRKK